MGKGTLKLEEIKKGDWLILMGFERNRTVKILKVTADNQIEVRMPEGDRMDVSLSDLRKPQ